MTQSNHLRRIRFWLAVFIIGPVLSGITAFPLETDGLPDLLYQEIVSVARRVKDMTRRSSRGCGKVGSDLCFPLFHAPGKLRSAMQPALVVCNPAMSEV